LRTVIEDRSTGDGVLVAAPRIWSVALAVRRDRPIVAADIASCSARTASAVPARAVDQLAAPFQAVSCVRIDAASYLPRRSPEAAPTRRRIFRAS
jgi:hypothetical protein